MTVNNAQLHTAKRVAIYEPSPLFPISSVRWDRSPVFSEETWATDIMTSQIDASPFLEGNFVPYCWQSVSVHIINSMCSKEVVVTCETSFGWLVACHNFGTQNESCRLSVYGSSGCRLNSRWRSLVNPCSLFNCSEPSVTPSHCVRDSAFLLYSTSIRIDSSAVTLYLSLLQFCKYLTIPTTVL